jgi:hypothetical protein
MQVGSIWMHNFLWEDGKSVRLWEVGNLPMLITLPWFVHQNPGANKGKGGRRIILSPHEVIRNVVRHVLEGQEWPICQADGVKAMCKVTGLPFIVRVSKSRTSKVAHCVIVVAQNWLRFTSPINYIRSLPSSIFYFCNEPIWSITTKKIKTYGGSPK